MQKRLGIDIDGTVTCPTSLIPFINKSFNLNITLEDLTEYELTECLDLPKEAIYQWFVQTEPLIYKESPIAAGARQVLKKWVKQHELYFISARQNTLLDVTEQWFQKHELDYHHIELIGTHDKVSTAKKHHVDMFFEDKHDNAVAISEELDIPVILFDTPYNRKPAPKQVIRVHHWKEAEQWVDNLFGKTHKNRVGGGD
ncbi:5' nucleotidase, NT5C type [Siminovitchia sp. 179-K 8D1 HS]|uniref:5' nucleotidase, NT5C type n=1 Tax=Siminovitchia sp. 179-K 8D1 HS TaxID=3142385 RepID=UPI0039A35BC8